jgi:hypothetical protein
MVELEDLVLTTALALLSDRVAVIPIAERSKTPALQSWREFQEQLPTEEMVRGWFKDRPRNLAVICGAVSGNLAVIDFDDERAADAWMKEHAQLIEECPVVRTSRGRHVYLRTERPVKSFKGPGFDFKGQGGYVLAPPSIHPTGARYELVKGDLANIPIIDPLLLGLGTDTDPKVLPQGWQEAHLEDVPVGERNNRMAQLVGRWFGLGLSETEVSVLAHALPWSDPLPDAEIDQVVRSLTVKEAKDHPERKERKITLLSVDDILAFPDPVFLAEGLIQQETLVLIQAYTGIGKSMVCLELAKCVLDGYPVFGKYRINKTGPVVLFDSETGRSTLKGRVDRMDFKGKGQLCVAFHQGLKIDDKKDFEAIKAILVEIKPALVIFDTLTRFHAGQENDVKDMSVVMERFRAIVDLGTTVIVQHHANKTGGNGDNRRSARGSSDIVGSVDLELALEQEGPPEDGMISLVSVKARSHTVPKVLLQIEDVGVRYLGDGRPVVRRKEDIKAILLTSVEGMDADELVDALKARGIKASRSTVQNDCAALADEVIKVMVGRQAVYRLRQGPG